MNKYDQKAVSAHDLIAAAIYHFLSVLLFPVTLIGYVIWGGGALLAGRGSGVSGTAQGPLSARFFEHKLGTREDEPASQLMMALPNVPPLGLRLFVWPMLLAHQLTGYPPEPRVFGKVQEMKYQKISIIILTCLAFGSQGCTTSSNNETTPVTPPIPSPSPVIGDMRGRASDGMGMVYVPAGEFMMGSNYQATAYARKLCRQHYGKDAHAACTAANFGDESPAHVVSLEGFWIDKTEVTNGQYQKCEQANACTSPQDTGSYYHSFDHGDPEYSDYPVTWITRDQAGEYCNWAGDRLPTEAEWEYAARGPESRIYPWGDSFDGTRLNYCDANCEEGPNDPSINDGYPDAAPVGSFPSGASWVGALDMAGNVREWVADWYGFYTADPQANPTGPPVGETVIPHGGSWLDLPCLVRSANRGGDPPDYTRHNVGFRCVMDNSQRRP